MRTNSRSFRIMVTVSALVSLGSMTMVMLQHQYFRLKVAAAKRIRTDVYRQANRALTSDTVAINQTLTSRIVLIGDSTISRWKHDDWPSTWEVLNRGIAGETSAQLVHRCASDAINLKPDVLVMQTGINDLVIASPTRGNNVQVAGETAENLKIIAQRGAAAGIRVVLITLIPPSRPELIRRVVWNPMIYRQVRVVNDALLAWVPPKGVTVVWHAQVYGNEDVLPKRFASDALHLNRAGYARLADLVTTSVKTVLNRCSTTATNSLR